MEAAKQGKIGDGKILFPSWKNCRIRTGEQDEEAI